MRIQKSRRSIPRLFIFEQTVEMIHLEMHTSSRLTRTMTNMACQDPRQARPQIGRLASGSLSPTLAYNPTRGRHKLWRRGLNNVDLFDSVRLIHSGV